MAASKVIDQFDIVPLTWVKGEIDLALDSVRENIAKLIAHPDELSPIRFSKTHLYQVTGAFDIVGLEGCKRFCFEIERLHNALEKHTVPVNEESLTILNQAVDALSQYLQDLMNGEPDLPFKLFPLLNRMMALQGAEAEESELFFINTSYSVSDDLFLHHETQDDVNAHDSETSSLQMRNLPEYYGQQRHLFQRSLLKWFTGDIEAGVAGMRLAVDYVQRLQENASQKTLWLAVSAFVDTLQQPMVAEKLSAKKLCRRVDQQMRHLVEGNSRVPHGVLKDALYYVAISEPATEKISKLKQAFALDDALSKQRNSTQTHTSIAQVHPTLIVELSEKNEQLKEGWSLAVELTSQTEYAALKSFCVQSGELLLRLSELKNQHLGALLKAIDQFSNLLLTTQGRFTEDASIEVAAGLTLLGDALNDYKHISVDYLARVDAQTKILERLVENKTEIVDSSASRPFASNAVPLALQQVKASLHKVEFLLEPYFLNPQQLDLLLPVTESLQQVFGSLELLNLALPAEIVSSCVNVIRGIYNQDISPEPATLECIATGITSIGIFIDEFASPRAKTEMHLQKVLAQLREKIPPSQVNPMVTPAINFQDTEPELLQVYIEEAEEVLAQLAEHLKKLHVHAGNEVALTELRRGYHTLKGSGRTVGLNELSEVAWIVEDMLNILIDLKQTPNKPIIDYFENRTADLARWIDQLRFSEALQIDLQALKREASTLMECQGENHSETQLDEVVIGGTYKLSRSVFSSFMQEAHEHIKIMSDDWRTLIEKIDNNALLTLKPSEEVRRAVHTLASSAGSAGFKAIHQLANMFEYWLESHSGQWQPSHLSLYESVISTVQAMLEKAALYRQPKQAIGLLNVLNESIEQLRKGSDATKKSDSFEIAQLVPARDSSLSTELIEKELEHVELTKKEPSDEGADDLVEHQDGATEIAVKHSTIHSLSDSGGEKSRKDYLSVITSDKFNPAENSREVSHPLKLQAQSAVDDTLLTLFLEEAKELVPSIGKDLIAWQKNPKQQQHLDALQRALHTLKGSARIASQDALGDAIHKMEGHLLHVAKRKTSVVDFDQIFSDWDDISGLLYQFEYEPTIKAAENYTLGNHKPARRSQFLRLRAEMLDRLMNDAGEISIARSRIEREMRSFKQSSADLTESVMRLNYQLREMEIEADSQMQSRMAHLKESSADFDPLEFDRYTRLQELTRMMAESVNDVVTIQHGLVQHLDVTDTVLAQQHRTNRDLQYALMSIRMLPFSDIVERLQRTVRMTAREQSKQVELLVQGEQIEIDRSVLDKLGAPLEHLLRNAVAHGIEMPEYRIKAEKPAVGTILVQVSREQDEIVIKVKDDGAGVNLLMVREQAVKQGLITEDNNLPDNTLMQIIFEPGFSTAQHVTHIAGRGVGLDSVRSEISALSGRIDISNNVGEGAVFTIYLPITLSVSQAVLVRVGGNVYAIPSAMVLQVQKLKPKDLIECQQNNRLQWSEQIYPLYYLPRLLGDDKQISESQLYTPVLMLRTGNYKIALHVDEVISNQEVVIKPLGKQMFRVPGMLGATILSDGKIALIINPVQLANRDDLAIGGIKASLHTLKTEKAVAATSDILPVRLPKVLVVDDSLTIRKVLSRLLDREGYQVVLAKDGMDALQKLQEDLPEIILTDIEMPVMDGFELVRNIKSDQRLANIPLIMISSRTAQKHRQLAESLGVDLFLGKPVQEEILIDQIDKLRNANTIH